MRVLRAGAAAMLLGLTLVPVALAQGPLEMTTAYPAVVADPGSTPKFPVTVTTDTAQRVALTVVTVPDGWTVRMRGAGSTIAAVTTAPSADVPGQINGTFTAEVTVPATVAPGSNQVVIEGRTGAGATARLVLDITTEEQQAGSVTLTTDFPNLRGSTTSNFRFNLTLANNTNQQLTFGLETDAPAGWDVEAKPSGEAQAATTTIDAGSDAQIQVTADPPADALADTYPIVVRAVGGPTPIEAELSVEVTGSFQLSLDTTDGRLNARVTAGNASVLNVVLTNTGSSALTNVTLTATPPRDWKVTFDQDTIAEIPAGSNGNSVNVAVNIEAAGNALAGDYLLTIRATSQDESSATDSIEVRTTVDTSPIGYLIGIGILIVVAVGLFFVFQRYGRR
jgi:uncharacterized membrane protein